MASLELNERANCRNFRQCHKLNGRRSLIAKGESAKLPKTIFGWDFDLVVHGPQKPITQLFV